MLAPTPVGESWRANGHRDAIRKRGAGCLRRPDGRPLTPGTPTEEALGRSQSAEQRRGRGASVGGATWARGSNAPLWRHFLLLILLFNHRRLIKNVRITAEPIKSYK